MNKYEWENVRGVQPFPFALICLSQPRLSHFLALILQFAPRIIALLIKIIWDSIFLKICIVLSTYFIK